MVHIILADILDAVQVVFRLWFIVFFSVKNKMQVKPNSRKFGVNKQHKKIKKLWFITFFNYGFIRSEPNILWFI